MKCYLIGGAVRDPLLGLPCRDRDWVVVGATPDQMINLGYRSVGSSFPVFLHPVTREEYALARKERKVAPGHQGFQCQFSPEVTLEEDLSRRDFSINAMAQAASGSIIDPFRGRRDLQLRKLRHISAAFREDPLRVVRAARFCAQLGAFEFTIAPETERLLETMSASGELAHLSAERLWLEAVKALCSPRPLRFFATLQSLGALTALFPALSELPPQIWSPSIPPVFHSKALEMRFAEWGGYLCRTATPERVEQPVLHWLAQLRAPKQLQRRARAILRYYRLCPTQLLSQPEAEHLFEVGLASGLFSAPDLLAWLPPDGYAQPPAAAIFRQAVACVLGVKLTVEEYEGRSGEEIRKVLTQKQHAAWIARFSS